MKHFILFLLLSVPLCAQLIVSDPINTAVNSAVQAGQAANHLEVLRQWSAQLENLHRQLRQLEEQLAVQRRIRDVIGDPQSAGAQILLHDLGMDNLARTYGETLQSARQLASAIESLRRTSDGIYREIDDRTVLGREFARNEPLYRRYAVVERQADNLADVHAATATRTQALQADLARTLERLRAATTQAETDKLNATIAALNGQLAHLDAQRRSETDKLWAAHILNENQAAKEQQDLLEKQQAEERDSLGAFNAWQRSLALTPTDYTRP
ncbi:MAG: hypothetical protein KA257_00240 [Opitutaceae bacterium]|nr:hypothetical protein [Opitutaceae bacterium]